MNWLLDTDVICQPAKKNGDVKVIAWLEAEQDRCYTSAVVIAQLAYWVRTKEGRQRHALQAWLTRLIEALHGLAAVRRGVVEALRVVAHAELHRRVQLEGRGAVDRHERVARDELVRRRDRRC